jgi:hypothetical protein
MISDAAYIYAVHVAYAIYTVYICIVYGQIYFMRCTIYVYHTRCIYVGVRVKYKMWPVSIFTPI